MHPIRRITNLSITASAIAAALCAAVLVGLWLAAPSQAVAEATRYVFGWLAGLGWLLALLGLGATRGRARAVTRAALLAGAPLLVAMVLGPGSVEARREILVNNRSGRPLTGLTISVGGRSEGRAELAAGASWEPALGTDAAGPLRLTARDADGALVAASTALLPGEPEHLWLRIDEGGLVTVTTRSLRSRWAGLPERLVARIAERLRPPGD